MTVLFGCVCGGTGEVAILVGLVTAGGYVLTRVRCWCRALWNKAA